MIFEDDDYTFIPGVLQHKQVEGHQWTWGPNGENSPEYNSWYWDTHKDEIMARRDQLKAEREQEAREHGAVRADTAENRAKDLHDARYQIAEEDKNRKSRWQEGIDYANEYTKKELEKAKKEESPVSSKTSSDKSDEDNSKSEKKGSGSKGSSGSSKKSSSDSGSKSKFSSNGNPKKSSGGSGRSSGGSSKKSSGEKAAKEPTAKKEKEKEEEKKGNRTDTVERLTDKGQTISYDKNTMKTLHDNFSKIDSDPDDEHSPQNDYLSFRERLIKNGYSPKDVEEGLELWEMFRELRGFATSKEKMKEQRTRAEDDEKRRRLQHGIDVFDEALIHHGIMGMKWYVRNGPPYPLKDDAHNAAEKKADWKQSLSSASRKARIAAEKTSDVAKKVAKKTGEAVEKAKSAQNARKEAKAKAEAEKAENERLAEEKRLSNERQEAIRSGNSQYAREHFNDMTDDEVNTLLRRLDLSQKVDKANHVMTTEDKIDELMRKVNKGRDWVDKGTNAWNSVAKIYNTMNGDDPLPVIGENFADTKRKLEKRKADEEFMRTLASNESIRKNLLYYTPDQLNTAKKYIETRDTVLSKVTPKDNKQTNKQSKKGDNKQQQQQQQQNQGQQQTKMPTYKLVPVDEKESTNGFKITEEQWNDYMERLEELEKEKNK